MPLPEVIFNYLAAYLKDVGKGSNRSDERVVGAAKLFFFFFSFSVASVATSSSGLFGFGCSPVDVPHCGPSLASECHRRPVGSSGGVTSPRCRVSPSL